MRSSVAALGTSDVFSSPTVAPSPARAPLKDADPPPSRLIEPDPGRHARADAASMPVGAAGKANLEIRSLTIPCRIGVKELLPPFTGRHKL